MLAVKTKCHCGGEGELKDGVARYFVFCKTCGFSAERTWLTMTVAIIDWEDAVNNLLKDIEAWHARKRAAKNDN